MILEMISHAHTGHTTNVYHQVVRSSCQCCSTEWRTVQAVYYCFDDKSSKRLCKTCAKKSLGNEPHILLLTNGAEYARYSWEDLAKAQQEARTLTQEGYKVNLKKVIWRY